MAARADEAATAAKRMAEIFPARCEMEWRYILSSNARACLFSRAHARFAGCDPPGKIRTACCGARPVLPWTSKNLEACLRRGDFSRPLSVRVSHDAGANPSD